jgi:hypothetical protein
MNNKNVVELPASNNYTAEQALQSAMKKNLTDVMVIAYDDDGDLFIRSSKMTRAEGLFMLEKAKEWTMYAGQEGYDQ